MSDVIDLVAVRALDRRPTIRDVAARAGVSLSTVSLVLNSKAGRIPLATREAVFEAAREIDYRTNAAARSLRLGRVRAVAVVARAGLEDQYVSTMLLGMADAARGLGYSLMLLPDADWQESVHDGLSTAQLDGVILHRSLSLSDAELAELRGHVVVVDEGATSGVSCVPVISVDGLNARRSLLEYVLRLGHRTVAYLSPRTHTGGRVASYREVLKAADLPFDERYIEVSGTSMEESTAVAQRLLALRPAPTAIVCGSDLLAAGAYQAAREAGLTIPDDLSVAAMSGLTVAPLLQPSLTALASTANAVGHKAVETIVALLSGRQPEPLVLLPASLVVRGSTTAPPRS